MGRAVTMCLAMALTLSACRDDVVVVGSVPAAPRALVVSYYGGAVTVAWELAPEWDGEAFRIYSRRDTDPDWFFIAEVTSCIAGFCTYEDLNVAENQTYEYYVAAVGSGTETATEAVSVFVPTVTPPPVPDAPFVIALDGANYLTCGTASRGVGDFSFYKVYLDDAGSTFLLGETDSEGFLDQLAENGSTYSYFVTAFDSDGHESAGSTLASGTPRPDYHGEWIYAFEDQSTLSGFRFKTDENQEPILIAGTDPTRDFRLESDGVQWSLVPGPNAAVNLTSWATSALKCGVAADADCADVSVAPLANYTTVPVELVPQTTYVLRMDEGGGNFNYGAVRVTFLGFDQADAIMIFDWAFQLQSNNLNLVSPAGE